MSLTIEEVLTYSPGRKSQKTVKKFYNQWRMLQDPSLPLRCDNSVCEFYNKPLIWNNQSLHLVLDHKNGVSGDNRPKNLQYLCPNCNSQQLTHGGGNKGKVVQRSGGFEKKRDDGKKDYTLVARAGRFSAAPGSFDNVTLDGSKALKKSS